MYKKENVGASPVFAQSSKARQNSGITLIALVITIIVMLILVAVTISMAVNGGLFEYAGKAVGDTQAAIDSEQVLANGRIQVDGIWYDSIDDYIAGIESEDQSDEETTDEDETEVEIPADLKVGHYVNYTPTAGTYKVADGTNGTGYTTTDGYQTFTTETGDSALKWRVLSIDEQTGEIEIVAEKSSSTGLYLKGADGYNHAVDILNDLCEALYSNTNGATARSIRAEDINAKTTYNIATYITSGTRVIYGTKISLGTYTDSRRKYPNLYSQEKGYGTAGTYTRVRIKRI